MQTKTYNGWRNYETWCVNLWLSNDHNTYLSINELASEIREEVETEWEEEDKEDATEEAACILAERIKEMVEEGMPTVEGLWADLLGAALSEVDWYAIAKSWLED